LVTLIPARPCATAWEYQEFPESVGAAAFGGRAGASARAGLLGVSLFGRALGSAADTTTPDVANANTVSSERIRFRYITFPTWIVSDVDGVGARSQCAI